MILVRLANPVGQISVSAFKNATLFGTHLGFDVMRMCRMCCAFHVLSLVLWEDVDP